ncbi:hypothetical protein QN277_025007 [Acacia crassicarpa]|uniref:Reverse transcriptase domain-containing protein n=1 Tax=Acacia crassicarpa TaxID=499986 RepID=A0AAE1JDD7_9FABA|nr:hypothetical protein QN277_025007 [Acacia crassicarpa]
MKNPPAEFQRRMQGIFRRPTRAFGMKNPPAEFQRRMQGIFRRPTRAFGMKNPPAEHQRRMQGIFNDFDYVVVHVDDILVFSRNMIDHTRHLLEVLRRFDQSGVIISKKKMELAKRERVFLGVTIGEGKLQLQKSLVQLYNQRKRKSICNRRWFIVQFNQYSQRWQLTSA